MIRSIARSARWLTFFLVAACALIGATEGADEKAAAVSAESLLKQKLLPLIEKHAGEIAVSIRHLTSGESFAHRADVVMPTASLIKLPLMVETYRQADAGQVDLNTLIELQESDKVPGSGILTEHFSAGSQLRLHDAIRLMIAWSDNTATNLVIDATGLKATAATMEQLGFPETKLHSKVYRGSTSVFPDRSREYGLGSTTAAEMIRLLELLHSRKIASKTACDQMLEHLLQCRDRTKLARNLPSHVKFAHKSGAVSAARCDAGLMLTGSGPIAICVLTRKNKDRSWSDDNEAAVLCGKIGRVVYDHFNPQGESSVQSDTLQIGDFGERVETLQRTLNERLQPAPRLSIDGDFGPATEAAVKWFQASRNIESTGVVEPATWKALSPLLTEDEPVPPPDVVNQQVLPVDAADPITGPPIVSCRAWVIADGVTGNILWQHNAEARLPFASTTKIMTACLVLRLAEQQPAVLDETIVFSGRADQTRGSSARIREGESLPVRELLYGLLLPSGNDAAVALAEHFGSRLNVRRDDPNDEQQPPDPLQQFVSEMNRVAKEFGMTHTSYRNPHGLSQQEHLSSAADLARLAWKALAIPQFRDYVRTRQRGCTLTGPGGYTRHIVWRNTNRLLGIEGFIGVKTGTTGDAGACLVSSASRHGQTLIVVVLGSKSSTGRYVDSRNLYRWAWQQQLGEDDPG